ncbi:tetratricopeptide repeat protein [Corallococcus praedator]|uniref:Tetratricopeptide repeat protein n=1 Tax=Corallococcus praedator TaxID=2316724 RepID=A0ABX9QBI4_9BACT|nr:MULTISPECIES: tetratricopeptide repeat protein [Corallococcus]RKH29556.1 tetratricopeptide repeat protein [Corallococcus sp. CA031C]RKH99981.1 tetratricopeptide repeat protein [Corallococcus praedator]
MKRLGRVGLMLGVLTLGGSFGCGDEKAEKAKEFRVKGTNFLADKNYAEATKAYEESLKLDPTQEKVWEKKAYAHLQLGQTDDAAQAALKMLDFAKTPDDRAAVYRNIAAMYAKNGPMEKAVQYFQEALKINPKDTDSLGWIAEMHSQRGGARSMGSPAVPEELEKALKVYDQVIAINPDSANSYLNKRVVMAKYMEHEKAMRDAAEQEAIEAATPPKPEKGKKAVVDPNAAERVAAAKASSAAHQTRIDQLQAEFNEMTRQFGEATKRAKAAQATNKP